ncbi:hypothetical protein LXM94_23425 [Rhizobium sp. TRM95111]|uniref:hypothetical protein n=1 Tax=Rhizobium alarense TaxID=2846851 RepID=UPI001F25D18A|nr:hypothetical protein [Rhizobium alarense]MCF3642921.1 hypothetical protein [Rhizobium alarense]
MRALVSDPGALSNYGDAEVDETHTMNFGRIKVLADVRKKMIAEASRLGEECTKMYDRKNALEAKLRNIEDRLAPIGFTSGGDWVGGRLNSEHMENLRKERQAVEVELAALAKEMRASQIDQQKAQEDATAANELHVRCEAFIREARA